MCDLRMFNKIYNDFLCTKKCYMLMRDTVSSIFTANRLHRCIYDVLRVFLECGGVKFERTHDIGTLKRLVEKHSIDITFTDWVSDHVDTLTMWESAGRYDVDFLVEDGRIVKALNEVEEFLAINGFTDELLSEITEKDKEKLSKHIPTNRGIQSNLEWNVLYKIFKEY